MAPTTSAPLASDDRPILVCGLGRLGQHSVAALRLFGAAVHGVDVKARDPWEVPDLPARLASFTFGDCRVASVLEQASLSKCRAALLVTGNDRINIAAAFAVRSLQPHIRLVVRSAQKNLNELLAAHLGNFVAYEPSELAAPAFALAALGGGTGRETAALVRLAGRLLRVVRVRVTRQHAWHGSTLASLQSPGRRVVGLQRAGQPSWGPLQVWDPQARIAEDDVVGYVDLADARGPGLVAYGTSAVADEGREEAGESWMQRLGAALTWPAVKARATRFWSSGSQVRRVAMVTGAVIASLYAVCCLLYWARYPELSWQDAANVGVVLILGGFDNLFGQLKLPFPIPPWLWFFSVLVSVSGTVGIGIVYAFLTERVLSVRFQFRRHRLPLARRDHVVLIGLGPIGERIASFLQDLRTSVVAVDDGSGARDAGLAVPVVAGKLRDAIDRVRLRTARSVVALDEDEVQNLEAALVARQANARATVIIRSDDRLFSENVAKLVPGARPLGVYALAAEAFATAAFGERVHGLLGFGDKTGVVTEYEVAPGDTLIDRLVGEIAYGYDVVPVLLERDGTSPASPEPGRNLGTKSPEWFPPDDTRLEAGDRLVLLATTRSLRDIEHGQVRVPRCRVHVDSAPTHEAQFAGAIVMVRYSGCDLATAQDVMKALPATLDVQLHEQQAERLVRELGKVRVQAKWTAE
jgi:Trk K+ transport system NAD-binding subunit